MEKLILLIVMCLVSLPAFAKGEKETAFDRVMQTGELRCGYYLFKPVSWRDANTGEMKGLAIDLYRQVEKSTGLKVKWVEEVTFGTMYAGLKAGRYDAICTPVWPSGSSARVATFTRPLFFAGYNVYVCGDDTRFDEDYTILNSPEYKVSVMDGSIEQHIAQNYFEKAKMIAIPQTASATQQEMDVVSKKSDAVFLDANRASQFLKNNPGSLKRVNRSPIQINPFRVAVAQGEFGLLNFLDTVMEEQINNGTIDRLLGEYELNKGDFLRVAKPYEVSNQ